MDETIALLPSDIRSDLAVRGRTDLFFFNQGVLGFRDMTPGAHGPLCVFAEQNPSQFKMMLMPRDHLKTSVLTIGGTMQKVVKDAEERILIANESGTNAQRMLRSIRQISEGNRVFRALYGELIPKDVRKVRWNDSELDFNREGHYPEPTIDSIGMTGAVTSRHYTHITYDDPISEEAVKSEKVMQDTISRMSTALNLLTDPSKHSIWLVGTRWALHDVYSEWMKVFGPRLARLVRAAIEDGLPIWPERFTLDVLALKRQAMTEYKFSCLMMNNPRDKSIQDLNIEDARYWEWLDDETISMMGLDGKELKQVKLEKLDITTTVDPAPAETGSSDRNAIVTVGVTPDNEAIVLEAWAERVDALQVIDHLFEVHQRFHPRVYGIEDVAYQKVLKVFLKQECSRRMVYMNIQPMPTGKVKKPIRIRGLQPYLATGRIYINANQHILRNEMADFPLGEHDDALDALSMHVRLWRGQMSEEARTKYQKSEEALIKRLTRGAVPSRQALLINPRLAQFDLDPEEQDEFNRPQSSIREVLIA
jgi:predicted phage terminase large subunit-like protein